MIGRSVVLAALLLAPLACEQKGPGSAPADVHAKKTAAAPASQPPQALLDGLVGGAAKYHRVSLTDADQVELLTKQLRLLMPDPDRAALLERLLDKGVLDLGVHLMVAHPIFDSADRARLARVLAQDYTRIEPKAVIEQHWPPAYRLAYTLACPAPDRMLELLLSECRAAGFPAARLTDPDAVRKRFPGTSAQALEALKSGGVVAVAGQPGDPPPRWLASARLGPGRLSVELLISEDRGPLADDLSVLMPKLPPAPAALVERLAAIGFWDGDVAMYIDPQADLLQAQLTAWVRARAMVSYRDGPEHQKLLDQGAREAQSIEGWGRISPKAFADFNVRSWIEDDRVRVELRWMTTPAGRAAFSDVQLPAEITPAHLKDLGWLDPIRKGLAPHLPDAGPLADGQTWLPPYALLHHWPIILVHGKLLLKKLPLMLRQSAPALFGAPGDEHGQRTFRLERTDEAVALHIVHTPAKPEAIQRKWAEECIESMEMLQYADPAEKEVLFAKECQPGCGYSYADGPGHRANIVKPGGSSRPCDRFCSPAARKAFHDAPLDQAWAAAYAACGRAYFDLPKSRAHLLSSEWLLVQRTAQWLLRLKETGVLGPELSERLNKASGQVRFGLPYPTKLDGFYRLPTAREAKARSNEAAQALVVGRKQLWPWPRPSVALTPDGARVEGETEDGRPGKPVRRMAGLDRAMAGSDRPRIAETGLPELILRKAEQARMWVLADERVSIKRLKKALDHLPVEAVTLGVQGPDGTAGGHAVLLSARTSPAAVNHELALRRDTVVITSSTGRTSKIPMDAAAQQLPKLLPKTDGGHAAATLRVTGNPTVGQLVQVLDGLAPLGVQIVGLVAQH